MTGPSITLKCEPGNHGPYATDKEHAEDGERLGRWLFTAIPSGTLQHALKYLVEKGSIDVDRIRGIVEELGK